jgi:hypothetical protein
MATTKVVRNTEYRKGYPYLVFVMNDREGWFIDSWHKTKREATAQAKDIENDTVLTEKGQQQ